MEQSDIKEILALLRQSIKQEDWDLVTESIDYLLEFSDEYVNDGED
jgi:hypothetical protein